jgi:hypothetical protein
MTTPPPSSFKPIVLTDDRGVAFLQRHPATREVVTTPSKAGWLEAALHFRDGAAVPSDDQWAMPNVDVPGDRDADLRFENTGHAPPLGFWVTHPDVLAWTTSALDGESEAWWVKVWLKR